MRLSTLGVSLTAAMVLGASAGCSSDSPKREFTAPKDLCGIAVPASSLTRLLPASGKQIDAKETKSDSRATCEVQVDGDVVLTVERERVDAGRSAWNIASYDHGIGHVKSGDDDAIAYVDRASVSVVPCRQRGNQDEAMSTYIRTLKPGRQDESAMRGLISRYTATLKEQRPC
ncbi:hypothetical protein [Streptomyces sp. NPDC007905]|uniref:hypothetical protein n=1 Tax=Streptomyces sp. NPDC007905 TaxID=3364788 RepID=UPI0036E6FB81